MFGQLNSSQKEAVTHIDGSMLILGGAGSGKTVVITARLAQILKTAKVSPSNILTLTFTNRASDEMRSKVVNILSMTHLSIESEQPLLCTFHKFGLLLLKRYISQLGRKKDFVVMDSEDKRKIIRKILKSEKIDLNVNFVFDEIARYKNTLLEPKEVIERAELQDYRKVALVYKMYQESIKEDNLVDFDDLLVLPYKILIKNDTLRRYISRKYRYIMVDEYQDTNELQHKLLKILASEHNNLCVVGDDDQSIYGWRGANIRNILEFTQNFKDARVIKLEINYRSTDSIVGVGNRLIEQNRKRIDKRVVSHREGGVKVELLHSLDESLEAKNIASKIKKLIKEGVDSNEIAVLYRVNSLSRSIEDGFKRENIDFKLVGGVRFYEKVEIKDVISYFKLISNPNDNISFLRVINRPKRGIGKRSIEKMVKIVDRESGSMFSVLESYNSQELISLIGKRSAERLKSFIDLVRELQEKVESSLDGFVEFFEERVRIREFYGSQSDGYERVLNIDEFYALLEESIRKNPSMSLESFLNDISLQNEQDQIKSGVVNIMNIHTAKGLEFEHLFVIGWEEGFLPLLGEGVNIEEERRVGYVAITRAKSHLTLCYCDSRFYKGRRQSLKKSRFLGEAGLIKNISMKLNKSSEYKKGDLVIHPTFGIGRVQAVTKSGREYKLRINFGDVKKEILSSFVKPI